MLTILLNLLDQFVILHLIVMDIDDIIKNSWNSVQSLFNNYWKDFIIDFIWYNDEIIVIKNYHRTVFITSDYFFKIILIKL